MAEQREHIFQNNSRVAGNGNVLTVGEETNLTLEIFGTQDNTARTITFYRKSRNGALKAIRGVRTDTWDDASSTTETGVEWVFDITNAYQIVMDLTSITGGSITAIGRLS